MPPGSSILSYQDFINQAHARVLNAYQQHSMGAKNLDQYKDLFLLQTLLAKANEDVLAILQKFLYCPFQVSGKPS